MGSSQSDLRLGPGRGYVATNGGLQCRRFGPEQDDGDLRALTTFLGEPPARGTRPQYRLEVQGADVATAPGSPAQAPRAPHMLPRAAVSPDSETSLWAVS